MLLQRARFVLPSVARSSLWAGRIRAALLASLTLATALMAPAASARVSAASPQSAPPGRVVDAGDSKPWPDAATLADTRRVAEARPLFAASESLVFSLVAGGKDETGYPNATKHLATAELFDPAAGTWPRAARSREWPPST